MAAFMITVVLLGWHVEDSAWAKACPEHQAVKAQVPDLDSQAQQFAIPPTIQQRAQAAPSRSIGWREGMVSTLIVLSALAIGLVRRLGREHFVHSWMPQLTLPFSNSPPLQVSLQLS